MPPEESKIIINGSCVEQISNAIVNTANVNLWSWWWNMWCKNKIEINKLFDAYKNLLRIIRI
ncbi:MAG: hypothetical protein PUD07_03005 [bacterium]|nr:hypothetical protein [bacterium]